MRNSLVSLVLTLAVIVGSAALLTARQQGQPGMSPARFWINNKTRAESIPVNLVSVEVDQKSSPLPVSVTGAAAVEFTDRAVGTLSQIQGRTQSTSQTRQPWEYRDVAFSPNQGVAAGLNALGADGWEATGMTTQPNGSVTVLLKRPR